MSRIDVLLPHAGTLTYLSYGGREERTWRVRSASRFPIETATKEEAPLLTRWVRTAEHAGMHPEDRPLFCPDGPAVHDARWYGGKTWVQLGLGTSDVPVSDFESALATGGRFPRLAVAGFPCPGFTGRRGVINLDTMADIARAAAVTGRPIRIVSAADDERSVEQCRSFYGDNLLVIDGSLWTVGLEAFYCVHLESKGERHVEVTVRASFPEDGWDFFVFSAASRAAALEFAGHLANSHHCPVEVGPDELAGAGPRPHGMRDRVVNALLFCRQRRFLTRERDLWPAEAKRAAEELDPLMAMGQNTEWSDCSKLDDPWAERMFGLCERIRHSLPYPPPPDWTGAASLFYGDMAHLRIADRLIAISAPPSIPELGVAADGGIQP